MIGSRSAVAESCRTVRINRKYECLPAADQHYAACLKEASEPRPAAPRTR